MQAFVESKFIAGCFFGHHVEQAFMHTETGWLSSKFELLISVLSVSVVGGSVVLHKTNTNKVIQHSNLHRSILF